jgi:hypothetical protein
MAWYLLPSLNNPRALTPEILVVWKEPIIFGKIRECIFQAFSSLFSYWYFSGWAGKGKDVRGNFIGDPAELPGAVASLS